MEKVCVNCGCIIDEEFGGVYEVDGEFYCEECYNNLFIECHDCGEIIRQDCANYVGCNYVCNDCFDRYYHECEDCGEFHDIDHMYLITNLYGSNYYVCEDCYYESYNYCEDCGDYYRNEDMCYCEDEDRWYCEDCISYHKGIIQDYHDFDDWCDHYVNDCNESVLKGFELEIESSSCSSYSRNEVAEQIQDIMRDFTVFENDGSLSNGFEIISNPFTMQYMYKHLDKFDAMFTAINGCDFQAKNTCGLHIHVNRDQLEMNTDLTQDEVIDNILIIMEVFKDELTKFSRREYSSLNHWAKFLTGEKVMKKLIDSKKGASRYHALNLTNSNTIEFRIFKSTTNLDIFIATIELVNNIVNLAKGNINGLTWNDIIENGKFLKDVSNNLVDESNTVLVVDDIIEKEVVERDNGLDPIEFNINGVTLTRGQKVMYGTKECVFLEVISGYPRILIYIPNFNGHSGNGHNNYEIPQEYQEHCWYVEFVELSQIEVI